jgi:xanthine dehydrogenase accessory factor
VNGQGAASTAVSAGVVLVKGAGDVGSAVAHALFRAGYRPLLVDSPTPSVARRRMAFADALYDGRATLEGVVAERADTLEAVRALLAAGRVIPILGEGVRAAALPADLRPAVVVDARMRKRLRPERQIDEAPLVIGLGPGFRPGETVHAAIETNWGADLGRVVWTGEPAAYTGEPRAILGYARERYVYAPRAGQFHTRLDIGARVKRGQVVGRVDDTPLVAQIDGVVRGIPRSGIAVAAGAKVVDVDPRGDAALAAGIGERPRRIAAGVLAAVQAGPPPAPWLISARARPDPTAVIDSR